MASNLIRSDGLQPNSDGVRHNDYSSYQRHIYNVWLGHWSVMSRQASAGLRQITSRGICQSAKRAQAAFGSGIFCMQCGLLHLCKCFFSFCMSSCFFVQWFGVLFDASLWNSSCLIMWVFNGQLFNRFFLLLHCAAGCTTCWCLWCICSIHAAP